MKHYDEHNYMRNKKNRIREAEDVKEESLKNKNEKKLINEQKYGKQKDANLIIDGENDRINGNQPKIFEDDSMKKAYEYGYFERGSRKLAGDFSKETYSLEEQINFGIADVKNGVPEKYLAGLKEYPAYVYGRNFQKGKMAYEFIIHNGMKFEGYVSVMKLMFPEVKTEAFKDGYYAREFEINNIQQEDKQKHK